MKLHEQDQSRVDDRYNHQSSNPYVPPEKSDAPCNQACVSDPTSSKIDDMLNRVFKRVKSLDNGVKELKSDVSNLTQTVSYHSASINHLETQINHLLAQMNRIAKGMLPSDTLSNPKNDANYMAIVTRSG